MSGAFLDDLARTVRARRSAPGEASYTRQLLDSGVERCARKFGEEALEAIIAAVGQSDDALRAEAADVLYHLIVLLEARGIAFEDVVGVLARRQGTSGLAEKASRTK